MQRIKLGLALCVSVLVLAETACTSQASSGHLTNRFPAETATNAIGTAPPPDDTTDEVERTPESEQPTNAVKGTGTTPTATERRALERTSPDPSGLPERVPTQEEVMVRGEVPAEILEPVIDDVVAQTGADREDIEILRAESVVWRDGSLGCPKPDMMYTQALVNGYWVVLGYYGQEYDYRVNSSGYFVLCDQPFSNLVSPLDGDSGGTPNQ